MKQPQRWRIANNSLHVLEQIYQMDRFPPQNTRNELANTLNVSARQIQVPPGVRRDQRNPSIS
jgi:hypothetical protein